MKWNILKLLLVLEKNVNKAFNLLARNVMDNYKRFDDIKGEGKIGKIKKNKKEENKINVKQNMKIHLENKSDKNKSKKKQCC